jgi:hypothetical protein
VEVQVCADKHIHHRLNLCMDQIDQLDSGPWGTLIQCPTSAPQLSLGIYTLYMLELLFSSNRKCHVVFTRRHNIFFLLRFFCTGVKYGCIKQI